MEVVFLGPPGAGKGTQAKVYSRRWGIPHVATGDLFRRTVQEGGERAQLLKSYMEAGKLVPDEVVLEMVFARLKEPDCAKGFILDGFPRTVEQAKGLDSFLEDLGRPLQKVVYFDVPLEELVRRLSGRRICKVCQTPYHIESRPPKQEGVCDQCGGELIARKDDTEEVIRRRFGEFQSQTRPLFAYYQEQGKLVSIRADAPFEEVEEQLDSIFGQLGSQCGSSETV